MASQIIDLTSDTDTSPTKFIYKKAQLPPIQQIIKLPSLQQLQKSTNTTGSDNEYPEQAIAGMDEKSLRALLKKVCTENASAMALVRSDVLISSDKVALYHADSDSEDRGESEEENSSSEEDEEPVRKWPNGTQCIRCPEAIYDDEEEGECSWHIGTKIIDHDSDVWYDYNEGQGPEEDHVDDPDYEEGFKWSCCGHPGSSGGCQEGQHIGEEPEKVSKKSLKRKAVEEAGLEQKRSKSVPRNAICENCKEQFDVTNNHRGDCTWHTEYKDVDYDSNVWADHDERCHGSYSSFEDNPDMQDGFTWPCCDEPGSNPGCKKTKHKALKIQERKKPRF